MIHPPNPSRNGGPTSNRTEERLSIDTVLEALLSPRRRRLLHQLKRANGRVSVDAMVDRMTAHESEAGRGVREDPTPIAGSLYHNHLPKLMEAGIIEFDRAANEIRYLSNPLLDEWLDFAAKFD